MTPAQPPVMTAARYATLVGAAELDLEREFRAALADAQPRAKARVGFLGGLALPAVWSVVLALAEPLARLAIRFVLSYLSRLTLGEVADLLALSRARQTAPEDRR